MDKDNNIFEDIKKLIEQSIKINYLILERIGKISSEFINQDARRGI